MEEYMRKPDFFIVGAPKCGTTALNEYLKQHPEIFIPERKELHFFGSDLHFKTSRITEEKYLSYFSNTNQVKRVGEASIGYLYSKNAANEIRQFCPYASIIIMLRNPIDMIYSLFSQLRYHNEEESEDLDAALDKEEARKRGLYLPKVMGAPVECFFYREMAKYTDQIKRYFDAFGRKNVHIIIFDDFQQNTAGVYKEMLHFLGVNQDFHPDFPIFNPNKSARSTSIAYLLEVMPLVAQRLKMSILPRPVRMALVYFYNVPKRLNTRYEPRPAMNPHTRHRLQMDFIPEIERLSELLDRDLTHWVKG